MSRHLPIRWRLTVWYATLTVATLAAFGLGLYAVLRLRLYQGFDEQLRNQAAVTAASEQTANGEPHLAAGGVGGEGEYFVRLLAGDGRVLFEADTAEGSLGVPLDEADVAAALGGETRYGFAADADGEVRRIVTVPVHDGADGPIVGALQFALAGNQLDDPLHQRLG